MFICERGVILNMANKKAISLNLATKRGVGLNITMKKSEVLKTAASINKLSNEFDVEVKKLIQIVDNINSAWNGADALVYVNNMREKHLINLKQMQDQIEEYGEYLRAVTEPYAILDEKLSKKRIDVD